MGVLDQTGSLGGFQGFGSQAFDTSTPDGLLQLAQAQGGTIASAADQLVNPNTSILSTIGNGFKNAFGDFVDAISTPSEAVAGIMQTVGSGGDLGANIGNAISNHIQPDQVLFGANDPNATTMQKVGMFLVRTATDIITDPLTYVTFGAGEGLLGLRATSEITLGENAAAATAREIGSQAALSSTGQDVYGVLNKLTQQIAGDTAYQMIKTGDTTLDMAQDELAAVMKITVDPTNPLQQEYAKTALSNLLEKFPQLSETLLDQGGIKVFGKSILSGQKISAVLRTIPGMSKLDAVTAPIRNLIQAPFNTAMEKVGSTWQRVPGEMIDLEQRAKDLATATADSRITNLTNVIKKFNLSVPEARLLTANVEAAQAPADARLAQAFKELQGVSPAQEASLKAAGIAVNHVDNHFPHMMVPTKMSAIPARIPAAAKTGATMERTLKDTLFTTDEDKLKNLESIVAGGNKDKIDAAMADAKNSGMEGFDDNFFTAHTARILENTQAETSSYMVKEMVRNMGDTSAAAKAAGWVPMDLKGVKDEIAKQFQLRGADGAEVLFHPAVAARASKLVTSMTNDEATSAVLKGYDSLQNYWKAAVTSIFPSFHGRNAFSNVLQSFMDIGYHALNPAIHGVAADMAYKNHQADTLAVKMLGDGPAADAAKDEYNTLMNSNYFKDIYGAHYTYGEMRQMVKNNGVAFTSRSGTDSADLLAGKGAGDHLLFPESELAGKVTKAVKTTLNPLSDKNALFNTGRKVGSALEDHSRLVHFVATLKGTGDASLAAKRTKQFLFDYNNMTNFERNVMRRLLPFYSYTRKNLEMQARGLLQTPGRTASIAQGLNTLGEVISGSNQLSQQEQDALPDWIKSGINILTAKNGENVTILSSLGTPLEQPFQALQANQLLGSLSPLIRVPVEQMSGYSFYQGKPLSEVTNATAYANAPQFIKQLIGYTVVNGHRSDGTPLTLNVSLNPSMMNLLNNLPPTARVLSAMKQVNAVDVSSQAKIMQQILGVKPYSFDLVQEQAKRQKELASQLQSLLTNAGVTAQFSKTFIPKAQSGI